MVHAVHQCIVLSGNMWNQPIREKTCMHHQAQYSKKMRERESICERKRCQEIISFQKGGVWLSVCVRACMCVRVLRLTSCERNGMSCAQITFNRLAISVWRETEGDKKKIMSQCMWERKGDRTSEDKEETHPERDNEHETKRNRTNAVVWRRTSEEMSVRDRVLAR